MKALLLLRGFHSVMIKDLKLTKDTEHILLLLDQELGKSDKSSVWFMEEFKVFNTGSLNSESLLKKLPDKNSQIFIDLGDHVTEQTTRFINEYTATLAEMQKISLSEEEKNLDFLETKAAIQEGLKSGVSDKVRSVEES